MNLHFTLARSYAVAMLLALLVFASLAVFSIDRTLRSSVDARLSSEARAAAAVLDVHDGSIAIDRDDQRQFVALLGSGADAAVVNAQGSVLLNTTANETPQILSLPLEREAFYSQGSGEDSVRIIVFPVMRAHSLLGAVIVWRPWDWIDETDRGSAIAFGVAAIVIAIIALVAGGAVTRGALDEALRRQHQFTADASHELRAPLAVIRAEADLALRKERSPQEYRTALESVAAEADRIEQLLGDMLLAARVQDRSLPVKAMDAVRVLDDVARRLAPAASAKHARIEVVPQQPLSVIAEPQSVERALIAVTHNAIKFAPEGGHVWLDARRDGNRALITVRDDGPGFSQEALESALQRFWRDGGSRSHDGAGLGLSIARSLVESVGGSIALENDGGAVVRMTFRAA